MEMVCTFLDNEEDRLPDVFDPSRVPKVDTDNCYLCSKKFSKLTTKMIRSAGGRHHCKKCGQSVCNMCRNNVRRLSKLDKKKYKICDQCDTTILNVNFEMMYKDCIEKQHESLKELKKSMHNKDLKLKDITKQLEHMKVKYEKRVKEISEKENERGREISEQQANIDKLRAENEKMAEELEECEQEIKEHDRAIKKKKEVKKEKKNVQFEVENKRLLRE